MNIFELSLLLHCNIPIFVESLRKYSTFSGSDSPSNTPLVTLLCQYTLSVAQWSLVGQVPLLDNSFIAFMFFGEGEFKQFIWESQGEI